MQTDQPVQDSGAPREPSTRLVPGEPKPSLRGRVQVSASAICPCPLGELRIPYIDSFLLCQHPVAVFSYLQKACDTTLHRWSTRVRLLPFLSHFLLARYFRVRLENVLSARCPQENGVPQDSVPSVILLAISVNGQVNAVGPSLTTSLYVDDVTIC
jgi:hypothetical protein